MGDSQFCLQWNSHNINICRGLSYLQQNEEFVDMTLAADGHRVKVHQMMLALASPYLKELIADANCPHPVIFLNKVSYKTMCSILEYVYLGESLVSVDDISDLLVAAKELRIKGLEDVNVADSSQSTETDTNIHTTEIPEIKIKMLLPVSTPQNTSLTSLKRRLDSSARSSNLPMKRAVLSKSNEMENSSASQNEEETDFYGDSFRDDDDDADITSAVSKPEANTKGDSLQYSVSNQGVLKLILNRYIYSKDHDYKDGRRRHWRCSNRPNKGCKANVVTEDNRVVRRIYNHNHPFHDKAITRLVLAGRIFGTLPATENQPKNPGTETGPDNDANEMENSAVSRNEETDLFVDSRRDDDYIDDITAVRKPEANTLGPPLQYSVSNQGVMKLILNRYIYSKDQNYKDKRRSQWRCSNRTNKGCRASVVTEEDVVVRRMFNHNHPFHDRAIMRLVMAGKIFGTLPDAEKLKHKPLGTGPGEPDKTGAERPCDRDLVAEKEHAESAVPTGDCESGGVDKAVVKVPCETSKTDLLPDRIRAPVHREKSGLRSHEYRHRTKSPRGAGMDNRESRSRTRRKSSGRRGGDMPFI